MAVDIILKVEGVWKSFGTVPVLKEASLEVGCNSVVGIVGENGAGKSTLFNIISGIVAPDRGRIEFNGREIKPANYRAATLLGISRVFQEQALIANVPVYENLLLSHEERFVRLGQVLDRRRMIEAAQRVMERFGLDIDVRKGTGEYDFSVRQSIEIARACLVPREVLGIETPLVLLDEPTSALARSAEEALFELIERIRLHGSVMFVSHRLGEVLRICDLVYVLKDGEVVGRVDPADADERTLHKLMVGRERDADYYHVERQIELQDAPPVLAVRGLTAARAYEGVALQVRKGEVLGIGGLADSGKSELGKGIVGLAPPAAGTLELDGAEVRRPTFAKLVARGLAYVPAERLAQGLIAQFSIAWNVSLAGGKDMFSNAWGFWSTALEERVARSYMQQLQIRASSPHSPCSELSGGNQQKVVLARWLCRSPRVMVLDNPTRGIDAGAKEEIYRLIRKLTADGTAIILITDELLELIGMSNRITVMRRGRITATLDAPADRKPTEGELVALMVGA